MGISDKNRFKKLLGDVGIEGIREIFNLYGVGGEYFIIKTGCCDKVRGYNGFVVELKFDEITGKFLEMGIWE